MSLLDAAEALVDTHVVDGPPRSFKIEEQRAIFDALMAAIAERVLSSNPSFSDVANGITPPSNASGSEIITAEWALTKLAARLALAGGTMAGPLALSGDPSDALHATTKQWVEALVAASLAAKLSLSGGTIEGNLLLSNDPTAGAHAVRKSWVDTALAARLALAGGTMAGPLALSGDPSNALHATTKQWVESQITAGFTRPPDLLVRDEKASGTDAGGSTSGAYATRALNTVVRNNLGGSPLSSNQVTLGAGNYYIQGFAPGYVCNLHKAKIRNITDAADLLIGRAAGSNSSGADQNWSTVAGYVTLATTKTLELQQRVGLTRASDGLGKACSFGDIEIYASLEIWKCV